MPKGIPQGLDWTKQMQVGDRCSYHDVNLWFSDHGYIQEINGEWVKVKWDGNRVSKEWKPNLCAWVTPEEKHRRQQATDQPSKWDIPLNADEVLRKAGLK